MNNDTRRTSVLIVEDEIEFRFLLRVVLDRVAGCEVVAESVDCADAIVQAAAHQPGLIFLDVHMPKGNGLHAVEQIDRASPRSTVIVMSSDPETRIPATRMGLRWVDKARLMRELPGILERAPASG
ncbi:MAG TPA: response regulator [Actinomycetota bacterium]|nr:response regulator [Actinomycetota bacterium]